MNVCEAVMLWVRLGAIFFSTAQVVAKGMGDGC